MSCSWIIGSIERAGGVMRPTLVLPHGSDPPRHVVFPKRLVDPPDGLLDLPLGDLQELFSSEQGDGGTVETCILHRRGNQVRSSWNSNQTRGLEWEIVGDVAD